jgi:hypothetical protein
LSSKEAKGEEEEEEEEEEDRKKKKRNYTLPRESRLKAKEPNKNAAERIKQNAVVRIGASLLDEKKQNRHSRSVIIKVRKIQNGQ